MPVLSMAGMETITKRQAPALTFSPEYLAYTNVSNVLAITGTFFGIALVVVLLRCWVRLRLLKAMGRDDYMMVAAMAFATATYVCFCVEKNYGLGKHLLTLFMNAEQYKQMQKVTYVHSLMVMLGISCVKVSVAFSLLRLATAQGQIRFLWGSIAVIIIITLVAGATLIFQCFPVEAAWDLTLRPPPFGTGDAKCLDIYTFRDLGLMNSIFNIITDVLFAVLPVPLIWKLQTNMRTKMTLTIILSLGLMACVAAIVKAVKQYTVYEDFDWTVHDLFQVWNFVELTVGIVAASLPTLKKLFTWVLVSARSSTPDPKASDRSSAPARANPQGYYNMSDDNNNNIILMQSFDGEGDKSRSPYSVQVSAKGLQHSGQAEKEAWDVVNARESGEYEASRFGYKEIMRKREIRIG